MPIIKKRISAELQIKLNSNVGRNTSKETKRIMGKNKNVKKVHFSKACHYHNFWTPDCTLFSTRERGNLLTTYTAMTLVKQQDGAQ